MLIRFIIVVYLLIFLAGLSSSAYLLAHTVALTPIPMIRLLQYSLLCVLFSILIINTLRAFSLKGNDLLRFKTSTNNFKWLFSIATGLGIAAWFGWFNTIKSTPVQIYPTQLAALALLSIFCFWSSNRLEQVVTKVKA